MTTRPEPATTRPTLAVTGSTGFIGGRVARTLADHGIPQRLIVRDEARAPILDGASIVVTSYGDAHAARRALDGVTTLFMVSGTESADRLAEHRGFIDAAADAGVRRVCYLSFFGAAPDATFTLARDHWHTEQHIVASGMTHTFLRDNLYADFLPGMVGEDGVIRGPAGSGAFAPVARRDVAEAAVVVLTASPEIHDRRTYDLTGPDLLTMAAVARTITQVTGREVDYHDETEAEALASRSSYGAPDWQVRAWVSTYQAIAAGELAPVSDDLPRLLGRRATSLRELLGLAE
jgi:uncharacterized protein YbjT (DUF2867 family)